MFARPHKVLSAASAAAAAAAAAADGASIVIFNDGKADPGEAASSPAAMLPTQRSNVTPVAARKETTRHIGVAAVKSRGGNIKNKKKERRKGKKEPKCGL